MTKWCVVYTNKLCTIMTLWLDLTGSTGLRCETKNKLEGNIITAELGPFESSIILVLTTKIATGWNL